MENSNTLGILKNYKMKKIILFFFLSINTIMLSQNKSLKLTYDIKLMFTQDMIYKGELISDGKTSIFKLYHKEPKDTNSLIFTNEEKTFENVHAFNGEKFIIEESLPEIKWEINNEVTVVNSMECSQATTEFAGRKYNVWFTSEIPISFGIFRLHNLPGAIIKLEDSTNEVIAVLNKIEYIDNYNFNDDFEQIKNTNRVERNQYYKNIEKSIFEVSNRLKTLQNKDFESEVEIKKIKMVEMID